MKTLLKLLDGKKTYLGIVATAIGVGGMTLSPEATPDLAAMVREGALDWVKQHWAEWVAGLGLSKTLWGAIHKDVKLARRPERRKRM